MSTIDTCNVLLATAHSVFSGSGGINSQLAGMALQPALPSIETILTLSAPLEVYEKTANVRYPVISIYCARLRNTQMEKFRVFSGNALLVVEIRVSGADAAGLETCLNSYVEAACEVLYNSRGAWTNIGTYSGAYDVKFQAMRPGGKQFTKAAQIEFEIQVSK
jgi:hypothetical protein